MEEGWIEVGWMEVEVDGSQGGDGSRIGARTPRIQVF